MATMTRIPGSVKREVRLEFKAPASAQRVALVGSFNDWNGMRHFFQRSPSGSWDVSLRLTPGRYPYRFLINNQEWVNDPKAQISEPNPFGGTNSVLEIK